MTNSNKPKRYSPYQPDQVAQKHNISIEEATERVNALKAKTNGSLSTYISRYGEEIGTIKFNEFRSKSKHTLETFVKKYGELEGAEKYKIYLSKKESRSDEYYKNKHGEGWEDIKRVDMENLNTYMIR